MCSHGSCAVVCGGGSARCGNNCVDLRSDPNNCGGCGNKCAGGQVCNKSTCALTCQSGLTNCNGGCVDLTSDDSNCNACGNACADGTQCVAARASRHAKPVGRAAPTAKAERRRASTPPTIRTTAAVATKCPTDTSAARADGGPTVRIAMRGRHHAVQQRVRRRKDRPEPLRRMQQRVRRGHACSGAHCCPNATPYYCGACDIRKLRDQGAARSTAAPTTCAINPAGALNCWGDNSTTVSSATPTGNATRRRHEHAHERERRIRPDTITCARSLVGHGVLLGQRNQGDLGNSTTTNTARRGHRHQHDRPRVGMSDYVRARALERRRQLLGLGLLRRASNRNGDYTNSTSTRQRPRSSRLVRSS